MNRTDRFPDGDVAALSAAKILGVRAGDEHRFTAVWVVVVEGRVFARSWFDKPSGWFRAFRDEPAGAIEVAGRVIPVRARVTRSARLREAVTAAYGEKYNTKASRKWVDGFAEPDRERVTVEFVPR